MEYQIYDFEITCEYGKPCKAKLVLLKEDDCGNCFGINRMNWPDTAFYILSQTEAGHKFSSSELRFLGDDYEELGMSCGDNYFSITINNSKYYIKQRGSNVELIDLDYETTIINNLKTDLAFEKLGFEELKTIIVEDGARGVFLKIDEILRNL